MSMALEQAEQTANRMRAEFLRTLDELDRRREQAMDVKHQARQHWKLLAGVGVSLAGMVVARVALNHWLELRREEKLRAKRRDAFLRLWEHPERVAPKRHAAPVELGGKVVTIVGTAVVTVLARKLATRLIG